MMLERSLPVSDEGLGDHISPLNHIVLITSQTTSIVCSARTVALRGIFCVVHRDHDASLPRTFGGRVSIETLCLASVGDGSQYALAIGDLERKIQGFE
jgi:hypothetical protein